MSQLFSFVGLFLVPLGVFWWWLERTNRGSSGRIRRHSNRFPLITLYALALITLLISLSAMTLYNFSFGILFLLFCGTLLSRAYFKLKRKRIANDPKFRPAPSYLIIIPVVVALIRFAFIDKGVQFSRDYAIKKSAPLIASIEAYYAKNGKYPISLQAIHTDILPGVIGIKQYHYEPNGAAYNLYFKQFSAAFGVEEIVMYNKLDEHAFAAHRLDLLEYSVQELALQRGDRWRYKLSTPHWIGIKFD